MLKGFSKLHKIAIASKQQNIQVWIHNFLIVSSTFTDSCNWPNSLFKSIIHTHWVSYWTVNIQRSNLNYHHFCFSFLIMLLMFNFKTSHNSLEGHERNSTLNKETKLTNKTNPVFWSCFIICTNPLINLMLAKMHMRADCGCSSDTVILNALIH